MEANDASLGSGDATTRAQELRASLGARQEAENLLAEAGRVRQDAASAADAMVEEAQQLSAQLVAESRSTADQINAEARERADGVLARARIEAEEVAERARATADAIRSAAETDIEEHRRRVRAEVTAQVTRDLTEQHRLAEAGAREQSDALISDLEASVRILGVSLESALANVSELLGSLEALRSTADPAPRMARAVARDRGAARRASSRRRRATAAQHVDETAYAGGAPWRRRRASRAPPRSSAPSREPEEPAELDQPETPQDRPRSATEAFLTSSSLEVEQAGRELRDLQHPEEARRRRSEESRRAAERRELEGALDDDEPEPDPTDAVTAAGLAVPHRPLVGASGTANLSAGGPGCARPAAAGASRGHEIRVQVSLDVPPAPPVADTGGLGAVLDPGGTGSPRGGS